MTFEPRNTRRARALILGGLVLALACAGCPFAESPDGSRPAAADKWFRRAEQDYRVADIEEARDSVSKALSIAPADPAIRLLAGRIALARLDYDETLRQLKGLPGSDAGALRGRALWYKGDLEAAADELEAMLNDPDVKDDWAKAIAKLARRGQGRVPFALSGAMIGPVDLPAMNPEGPAFFIVPLEIDGESGLGMVSTGYAEVVLDSASRQEPSWVSLRFGGRLEVHDVPAMTQDLSGLAKQMGAPIRALLGVNLLRHLNATIDYSGRQFVARSFAPPPPPAATRVNLYYYRGGGMVLKALLGADKNVAAPLLIDTANPFPIALDKEGWKKAGFDVATLQAVPGQPQLRQGVLPMVRLGAFDVPKVPGVFGSSIDGIEKMLGVDIDGVIGSGLLSHFRVTLGDGGRVLWMEDNSAIIQQLVEPPQSAPPPPAPPPPAGTPPAGPKNQAQPPGKAPAPAPAPKSEGGKAPSSSAAPTNPPTASKKTP